jgi:TIR domain-containing protein
MTGKIFINYRRGDDPGHTGRLFDRLQDVFEPQQLFLDVDNIAPGLDFIRVLNERVAECDVVLAVIGKGWIDARDETGRRRLDDPADFVRIEIISALDQGKRVIPVLVNDAPMPRPEDLPEALRPLLRRNAVRLTHERFRADTQGLIKALQQSLDEIEVLRQAEAEAARRVQAEEEERRKKADREAQERAADERRRQEAEAKQRAGAERAFTLQNAPIQLERSMRSSPPTPRVLSPRKPKS